MQATLPRMPEPVLLEVRDEVATVMLNRPGARNPTSIALLDAMDRAFDRIDGDDAVQVVVLAGAGRSFCAGLDLAEVRADRETIHTLLRRLSEVMRRIRRLSVPTIARVQGAAIGGGFGFLAAADFAVSHAEAKIGYPALETGLSGALMAPWLVRKIGPSRARAMLLLGGTISGSAAAAAGIVTHLVEADALETACAELAAALCKGGPEANRTMKAFLNELDGSRDDPMLDRAAEVSARVIASAETQARLERLLS